MTVEEGVAGSQQEEHNNSEANAFSSLNWNECQINSF